MSKAFGEIVTNCPKCGEGIGAEHPYTWCAKCGEALPQDVLQHVPAFRNRPQSVPPNNAAASQAQDRVSCLRESSNYKGFRAAVVILAVVGYIGVAAYVIVALMAGTAAAVIAVIVGVISVVGVYVSCQALQILADISDKLVSKE